MNYMFDSASPIGSIAFIQKGTKFYCANISMGIYGRPRILRRKFKTATLEKEYGKRFCARRLRLFLAVSK